MDSGTREGTLQFQAISRVSHAHNGIGHRRT